jgi:sulfoxide reductase catalytic subunit YedY
MLIKRNPGWRLPESQATPEAVYLDRRRLLQTMGFGAGLLATTGLATTAVMGRHAALAADAPDPTADLYPAKQNPRYTLDRALTPEKDVTTYNNFYEFGSDKDIWEAAQELQIRPWTVKFEGMVEQEREVDIDTLIRAMPLEERLYRHRCVEAWSMAVPWTGFPLKALIDYAKPTGSAKYVRMETFQNDTAPGFAQTFYPWPYVEGLTMAEATNELAFMVTGLYGKPVAKQDGAPLRLVTPWKYGFKSIKSIIRISFTDERPVSFWEQLQSSEYGFWANVNPEVPHPRWSQAMERVLGTGDRVPTLLYNGYGEYVADLYKGLESERLYT